MTTFLRLPLGPLKLWVDDARPMPDRFNCHARTASEALAVLRTERVVSLSLDHDLGSTTSDGCVVAEAIERGAYFGTLPRINWTVHSANPVGRQRIEAALRRADSYWTSNEKEHDGESRT